MPMPIRTYDVMALILRACAISMMVMTQTRHGLYNRSTLPINEDMFFQAIVNRLMGRPNIYCVYKKMHPSLTTSFIPCRKEIGSFLDFVIANNALPKLFSSQHFDAIPRDVKTLPHVFRSVVEELSRTSHQVLSQMTTHSESRHQAVRKLSAYLSSVFDNHKTLVTERKRSTTKSEFLAHQIICDLEEVYVDPFGQITEESVMVGYGGKQGLRVCAAATDIPDKLPLTTLCQSVAECLRNDDRMCCLWRRITGTELDDRGNLIVALNGRLFSCVDIEHIMCKVYVGISKTISTRSTSRHPVASKPGLFPLRLNGCAIPWDNFNVRLITMDIEKAYCAAVKENIFLSTPEHFRLNGEADVFDKVE